MRDLSTREFSDLTYTKLSELPEEIILSNPNTENEFPLREMHAPLKNVQKSHNGFPLFSIFQISITCWNDLQRATMDMTDKTDKKLQELNFVRTNTSSAQYDPILKKYGITTTYEVKYNSITASFDTIK